MPSIPSLLSLAHLIGLALGVGSATAKLTLLLRCKNDLGFLPAFIAAARPITRLIILGLALLTLSGIGWLIFGYPFTPLLLGKLALVAAVWVMGPIIDNVVEPKFLKLAPRPGEPASREFLKVQQQYLMLELLATGLFYIIIVMWMLF